ncbi:sirohydrochlorin chelatase [Brevibacillus sp. GCM10020057]|uniref:sirohydrochlorin chelatase n=1 Tax=Brevibacillus sp. GCM10020057 TaxID=3317327 RepID=UPI0036393BF3
MEKTAVLLIAHGSPDPEWVELVESAVRQCCLDLPVRVAFLGGVEGRSIADEWICLEKAGARRIVTVPLFVTAGSSHVTEIRAMLGLEPGAQEEALAVRESRARTLWCSPLEDHPVVEKIVTERVQALTVNPRSEALLLVGHGNVSSSGQAKWERLLQRLTLRLQNRFLFAAAGYGTLRPDTLREQACALAESGDLIVVPLFVSQGYFTRRAIPQRLEGLPFRYDGSAYLPHPLMAEWITQSVRAALRNDLFTQRSVYVNGREKTVEVGR